MEDANWLLNKLIFIAMQMLLSTSMVIFTCFCVACYESGLFCFLEQNFTK